MDNPYQIPQDFIDKLQNVKVSILNLRKSSLLYLDKEFGPMGLNFCRWFLKDLNLIGRNLSLDDFRHPEPEEPLQLYTDEGE